MSAAYPNVLCLSGHDPTGGAGIQADIETIAALGGHALTVITAHTVQDTGNVTRVVAPDPRLFKSQIEALLTDCPIHAVKIGLLGETKQVAVIAQVLRRMKAPVVLDPVLRAGGGRNLAAAGLLQAIKTTLLPRVDVLTPNAAEARRLIPGARNLDDCGAGLLALGAKNVLITGGDDAGLAVVNTWHRPGRAPRRYSWPRLHQGFHGAGCTLASAIAVLLAQGHTMAAAIQDAQAYTQETLKRAVKIGHGRSVPRRLP